MFQKILCGSYGVAPAAGSGLTGGDFAGGGDEAFGGCATGVAGEAAGLVGAPGCVPGGAPGGFTAAAGCPRLSEFGPWTDVGFGVALAVGAGEADAAGAALAAGEGSGVAMGPATIGFLDARSTTASSIARSIGTRTVPLLLSIQA